jgi:hypothetical protein
MHTNGRSGLRLRPMWESGRQRYVWSVQIIQDPPDLSYSQFDRLHSRGFLTTDVLPQERTPSRLNLLAIEDRCQAVPMHGK